MVICQLRILTDYSQFTKSERQKSHVIKVVTISTYALYWLLFLLFTFDYNNYNQSAWETVTNYWCFGYVAFFFYSIYKGNVWCFSKAVFVMLLLLTGLDLAWYTTDLSSSNNLLEYKILYLSILIYTFVVNEFFKR